VWPIRRGERERERERKRSSPSGGAGSLLNQRRRKEGRGRGPGGCARVEDGEGGSEGGPCTAVGSAGRPVAAPDRRAQAVSLLHEHGRAAGRGRHGAGVTDRRDRGEAGPGVSSGVRERAGERGRAMTGC
jgi:hypothetical protein